MVTRGKICIHGIKIASENNKKVLCTDILSRENEWAERWFAIYISSIHTHTHTHEQTYMNVHYVYSMEINFFNKFSSEIEFMKKRRRRKSKLISLSQCRVLVNVQHVKNGDHQSSGMCVWRWDYSGLNKGLNVGNVWKTHYWYVISLHAWLSYINRLCTRVC